MVQNWYAKWRQQQSCKTQSVLSCTLSFPASWYYYSVPPKTIPEFESGSNEYRGTGSDGEPFPQLILLALCCVALFVLLGLWTFTLQVIPLDEEIIPKQGSTASWILGDGFAQTEFDGAWMTALNSSINFFVDSWTKTPRSMTLTFVPLLGPTRPRRVLTVSSAGASVTKTITGIDSVTIALNGDSQQAINISCDSVDSANSLRVGPDLRPMCVKIISLVVKST